jgi:DNA-binding FadR family transcriptional regulator
MEGLKSSFNSYFKAKKFALGPERKDLLQQQHQGVYMAIKQKNQQAAKDRMIEHLEFVEEVIRRDFLRHQRQRRRPAAPVR